MASAPIGWHSGSVDNGDDADEFLSELLGEALEVDLVMGTGFLEETAALFGGVAALDGAVRPLDGAGPPFDRAGPPLDYDELDGDFEA